VGQGSLDPLCQLWDQRSRYRLERRHIRSLWLLGCAGTLRRSTDQFLLGDWRCRALFGRRRSLPTLQPQPVSLYDRHRLEHRRCLRRVHPSLSGCLDSASRPVRRRRRVRNGVRYRAADWTRRRRSKESQKLTGFPDLIVPAGFTGNGLPGGISFLERAFDEPGLLALGYAFEQIDEARRLPVNTPTLED